MGGYIIHFTVYTMAMIGLICFAVFVYKKFTDGSMRGDNTKFLSVEDSMSLSPRKTLHVVRAGNEKFLIASDVDRTTLISKLDDNSKPQRIEDLERFRNIELVDKEESAYMPEQVVDITSHIAENRQPQQPQQRTHKQPVHLEPINTQTAHIRRGMDRRASKTVEPRANKAPQQTKTVTLDFDTPKNHGFTTMKEMAKKINEL